MRLCMDRMEVTVVEVDFPDICPRCGADFLDEEDPALVRYDARYEQGDAVLDDGSASFVEGRETDFGECVATNVDFGCGRCQWMWSTWKERGDVKS